MVEEQTIKMAGKRAKTGVIKSRKKYFRHGA
jgi:hypothetical protein